VAQEEWVHLNHSEDNLDYMMDQGDLQLKIKELKAALNENFFGRIGGVSRTYKESPYLYHCEAIDTTDLRSSFAEVSDAEIDLIVWNMNQLYEHYRRMGFEEIYLSIIPNKESFLLEDAMPYNHLIERIQDHPALKIKILDAFHRLKSLPGDVYYRSDTHWKCSAKNSWLDMANHTMKGEPIDSVAVQQEVE
jgi:hypothetical protein